MSNEYPNPTFERLMNTNVAGPRRQIAVLLIFDPVISKEHAEEILRSPDFEFTTTENIVEFDPSQQEKPVIQIVRKTID